MPRLLLLLCFIAQLYSIWSSVLGSDHNKDNLMVAFNKYTDDNKNPAFLNYVYNYFRLHPKECASMLNQNNDLLFGVSLLQAITYSLNPHSSIK
jgi:hypothetical protein